MPALLSAETAAPHRAARLRHMVLEATYLCVDNSDYMRNGDFAPSRMEAQPSTHAGDHELRWSAA